MRMMVYWTMVAPEALFHGSKLIEGPKAMDEALALMEAKRREGARFVCWASESDDLVGKPGVDAVEGGKTPDGHAYEWSKAHRGAGPRPEGS